MSRIAGVSALALSIALSTQSAPPLRPANGLVAGVDAGRAGGRAYKGLPYAAPPIGERRWRACP